MTARFNIREDNVVVIDLVTAQEKFGFYASQNISECSFRKNARECVSMQQQTWSECSDMKLAVIAFKDSCFIQNKGLALTGILAKKFINLLNYLKGPV